MATAVITGVTGQDGATLTKQLLEKEYKVIGVKRRSSTDNLQRLRQLNLLGNPNLKIVEGEVSDTHSVYSILNQYRPDEIYNLAAMSHVYSSFSQPKYTLDVNYGGVLNILEWLRHNQSVKLYQASSSEQFGNSLSVINEFSKRLELTADRLTNEDFDNPHWKIFQDEKTPFKPQSPYAVSKVTAHQLCELYRDCYNLQVWPTILMNHEGPLRGPEFVTRKITIWANQFKKWLGETSYLKLRFDENNIYKPGGVFEKLRLGNITAKRDWGASEEYTQIMWRLLNETIPETFLVATGQTTTVKEFLEKCLLTIKVPENFWTQMYVIDTKLFRAAEVPYLCGNSTKIQKALNWTPKYKVDDIVRIMMHEDSK